MAVIRLFVSEHTDEEETAIEVSEEVDWEEEQEFDVTEKPKIHFKGEKCPFCGKEKMQFMSIISSMYEKTLDYFCHSCGRYMQKKITYNEKLEVIDEIMSVIKR